MERCSQNAAALARSSPIAQRSSPCITPGAAVPRMRHSPTGCSRMAVARCSASTCEGEAPRRTRSSEVSDGIRLAPSLGDVATTVSYPASTSHRALSPQQRAALGISDGLVRISVGIEHIDDLTAEFDAALVAASAG